MLRVGPPSTRDDPGDPAVCPHQVGGEPLPDSYLDQADQDPFPFFEALRSRGAVVWDERMEVWLLTRHEDCAFVQRHEELFAVPYAQSGFTELFGRRGLFMLEGEAHRRLYTRVTQFFSPGIVNRYRETVIRPLVHERIDRFAARGRAELGAEFAEQVPVRVIAALLDLPWRDEALAARCWDATAPYLRYVRSYVLPGGATEPLDRVVRAMHTLDELLLPAVRRARAGGAPPDSYVARLWEVGASLYDDWSEADVLDQCRFLFVAGMHTTAELICSATYLLLTRPQVRDRVASHPDRALPAFVEEALRLAPPLHHRPRVATRDVELGGTTIRTGQRVLTLMAAANRDPARYDCPADVDLERRRITDHLSFNTGPRFCSGAPLARAEGVEALAGLLVRLPDLRLDPDAPATRLEGFVQRAFRPLHVRFEPQSSLSHEQHAEEE